MSEVLVPTWSIKCNRCKIVYCNEEYGGWDSPLVAREVADGDNWLNLGNQDFCDSCVTEKDCDQIDERYKERVLWQREHRLSLCAQGLHTYSDHDRCRACYKDRDKQEG